MRRKDVENYEAIKESIEVLSECSNKLLHVWSRHGSLSKESAAEVGCAAASIKSQIRRLEKVKEEYESL